MSAASNYTEQNTINAALRGVAYPLPSGTYVSLHTADPGETGLNEVSTAVWPQYARVHAEQGGAIGSGWSEPSDGMGKNTNQLTFPSMDGEAPLTITHFAVWDAPTGGNMIVYMPLQTPREMLTGDIFVFDSDSIEVRVS